MHLVTAQEIGGSNPSEFTATPLYCSQKGYWSGKKGGGIVPLITIYTSSSADIKMTIFPVNSSNDIYIGDTHRRGCAALSTSPYLLPTQTFTRRNPLETDYK